MASIQLICPHCKATLTFHQAIPSGTPVTCLSCNRAFSIPAAATAPPAPPAAARPRAVVSAPPAAPPVPPAATRSPAVSKAAAAPLAGAAPATPSKNVTRPALPASRAVPAVRDPAPVASGGDGRIGVGIILVLFALIFFGGLAFLVYATGVWQRLFEAPTPAIAEGPKDKAGKAQADKDQADKDETNKDKTEKSEDGSADNGNKDGATPPPKGADIAKKDGKSGNDSAVDVADLKQPEKQPTPVLPDPPVKQPEKQKEKKIDPPDIPVVIQAPPIAPGVTAADIDKAIERGVKYLKDTYDPDRLWGGGQYPVGYASFAGLALLECKVPAKDPMIQNLADKVRRAAGGLNDTYQGSLAVLFLDKLGDPKDDALIRALGLRIVSGQMDSGAWPYSYQMLDPTTDGKAYYGFLKTYYPWSTAAPRPSTAHQNVDKEKPESKKGPKGLEIDLNNLPIDKLVWTTKVPRNGPAIGALGTGDNSNSQFALLALWAGRRHDVPAECPILLSYARFRATQNSDGGWGYKAANSGAPGGFGETHTTNTMTCAGLLGLALGPGALPPGSNVGDKDKIQEPVSRGLACLGSYIGNPGPADSKPAMQNMYFLWSVERVGVLYDLKTIGGKDWYGWGAQILLKNQHGDGHWHGADYQGVSDHLDTCFALLFLKRANLVADLTESIRLRMVITDPGAKK